LDWIPHNLTGFCTVSDTLPLPKRVRSEVSLKARDNGLNPGFNDKKVHCVAAQPMSVFLRASVTDGGQEIAYETAVLGRLRGGYRVLCLRGPLGTRIELCVIFVRISFGVEPNHWASPRQQEQQIREQRARIEQLEESIRLGEVPPMESPRCHTRSCPNASSRPKSPSSPI
jgi:hypothetical protein